MKRSIFILAALAALALALGWFGAGRQTTAEANPGSVVAFVTDAPLGQIPIVQGAGHTTTILSFADIDAGELAAQNVDVLSIQRSASGMPAATQTTVLNFVKAGGGLLSEFDGTELLINKGGPLDVFAGTLVDGFFVPSGSVAGNNLVTVTDPGDPLAASLPATWTSGEPIGVFHVYTGLDASLQVPIEVLGTSKGNLPVVASACIESGRVVPFFTDFQDFAGTSEEEQLLLNAIDVAAAGCAPFDVIVCDSPAEIVCKKLQIMDQDGDGIIEVGEPVDFFEVIEVQNPSPGAWTNTEVTDSWGAEIDVTSATPSKGTATLTTDGTSDKEFLGRRGGKNQIPGWVIGTLGPGETANLVLESNTDLNPAGQQEYSECSLHEFNSGAVLKFRNPAGKQVSFETGGIVVSVLTEDAQGDCDGDGFSDVEELDAGSDPHDPADSPGCRTDLDNNNPGNFVLHDVCIDADGTATVSGGLGLCGFPVTVGAAEVTVGDPLALFPTVGFNNSGLDMFDNDGSNTWTFTCSGDDLHVEGPTFCPTAIRNGIHELGLDCKVLDYNGSLFTGQPVNCDLEVGAFCVPPLPSPIKYFDANNNNVWDDGEDIVLDVNGNGIFD